MRRRAPWLAFGLALAVVLGVMGWVTSMLLAMERDRVEAEQAAAMEEQVRLALWRIDSAVPPRLFREMAEVAAAVDRGTPGDEPVPPEIVARAVYRPDGEITWLAAAADDELAALGLAVKEANLLARLDNPIAIGEGLDGKLSGPQPQASYYSQATQQYRSGNEWQKRKVQVLDNLNTIEQAAQIGKGSRGTVALDGLDRGAFGKAAPEVVLGVPEPVWLGERLVVTRIARRDGEPEVHISWLDFPELSAALLTEIADLLPDAELLPAAPSDATPRMLATLPVRLEPGAVATALPPAWSPLRASLVVGWVFVLLATGAVAGLLLWSLALSERRAAFVSAVTHELRTPLTTFRMYTEMLSEGMIEEKRDHYVATLRREAERLGHLVENVLSYARIEGGRKASALESMPADDVVARAQERLTQRCAEAGMELEVEIDPAAAEARVRVDATAVEQILFNLVDNAAKYAPSEHDPRIVLSLARTGGEVELRVRDFGPGIPAEQRRKVFEPFAKADAHAAGTQPGVGLGLALCRRLARQMRGDLKLQPATPGAAFVLTLPSAGPSENS